MISFSFIVKGIAVRTDLSKGARVIVSRIVFYVSETFLFDYSTNCRKLVGKCLLFTKMKFTHWKCYTNCIQNGHMEHDQIFGSTSSKRYILHKTVTICLLTILQLGTDGHITKYQLQTQLIHQQNISVSTRVFYIYLAL